MSSSAFFSGLFYLSAAIGMICAAFPAGARAQSKIEAYINAAAPKLGPNIPDAIGRIEGAPRRLLALRGYLRSGGRLKSGWSWSGVEIAKYKGSAEYKAALAEIDRVRAQFEQANPGYTLQINTEIRSLDAQIANWNRNQSVGAAAEALFAATERELASAAYKDRPDGPALTRFQAFLRKQPLSVTPTLATPGLSQHGQLRAFDFHIKKGSELVATTDSSTIRTVWDGQGWTDKLKAAVTAGSRKLSGPLASPREPWHYAYTP